MRAVVLLAPFLFLASPAFPKNTEFAAGPENSTAPIRIKSGAEVDKLDIAMNPVRDKLIEAFKSAGVLDAPTITSGSEKADWRTPSSLHRRGRAIDVRGKTIPLATLKAICTELQNALGPDFDVVLENYGEFAPRTHIHIEFDPK